MAEGLNLLPKRCTCNCAERCKARSLHSAPEYDTRILLSAVQQTLHTRAYKRALVLFRWSGSLRSEML